MRTFIILDEEDILALRTGESVGCKMQDGSYVWLISEEAYERYKNDENIIFKKN